jgi:hypothetical protein
MTPTGVPEILGERGIQPPQLLALKPNIDEYTLLAYQPQGDIRASTQGVANRSTQDAIGKGMQLLLRASKERIELLVTPEYSLPWRALIDSLRAGNGPEAGCLWALGCESVTVAELGKVQSQLDDNFIVVHEPLDPGSVLNKTFLDPLAYVFKSTRDDGRDCTVILIQFKTHPSVDAERIEIDNLIRGSAVYVFSNAGVTIRLFSFICSDVLNVSEQMLKDLYDGSLILHIQLNPKPRESAYRNYRKQILTLADDRTELLCVNWAAGICCWNEDTGASDEWKNIGGSAWYLRPRKFDLSDPQITANHRRGLYYTWLDPLQCNVLFLNYQPGVYQFTATKVWHHGVPQVQSKRTGPRLLWMWRWDAQVSDWAIHASSDDGFHTLISPWSAQLSNLSEVYSQCPVATERLLALVQGNANSSQWHSVRELASFIVEESERIQRITFAQDTDPGSMKLREHHIQHFVTAQQAFQSFGQWPPELHDLQSGWTFEWSPAHPHCNLRSQAGKLATLVYCIDNTADHQLQAIGDALRQWLTASADPPSRLAILYRKAGQLHIWRHPESKRFDKPAGDSPAMFTEAT